MSASDAPLHPAPGARPWAAAHTRRLPGTGPVAPADWLRIDALYGPQMAERERLIAERPGEVLALDAAAEPAAAELLARVLEHLAGRPDFAVGPDAVVCPDGRQVPLGAPLATLGRLVQEDFCLLLKPDGAAEHLLAGAVLCFPSGWTLAEKMHRPLAAIHRPVAIYDTGIAARVQRLCDGVSWERPLMRANAHTYDRPPLFDPRREDVPKRAHRAMGAILRVERQVLRRLPESGAVVFSIHTSLTALADLPSEDRAALLGRA